MNAIKSLCLCALVLLTAACGPADECELGDQRACYTGAAGTVGQGPCLSGSQACRLGKWEECRGEVLPAAEVCDGADNDCDSEVDNGVKNACGGCAAITDQPGADCSNCGTFACDGLDALDCAPPTPAPGATCVAANGCAGAFACGADRAVTCVATAQKNECGVCGGPALADVGAACTANGCAGVNACDEAGTALVCIAPVKNNCGVCGAANVATVGDACSANDCAGTNACNATNDGVVCNAPAKNSCGLCAGPVLAGAVGDVCGGAEGTCAGVLACNAANDAYACTAPARNNCGVCGAADVATVGDACTADGCAGTNACNASKDGVVCNAPAKNSCGLCGGPVLTGAVGDVCGGADGTCAGVLACNAARDAYACTAPARNNCGVCGATDVAAVGAACTAGGCEGTNGCNASKDGVVCNAPEKNDCGLCAGPAVPNLSSVCTAANTCEGHLECNDAADALVCLTAIVKNACGVCGGPVVTGLGAACTTAGGAPGVYACNPAGAGVCIQNIVISEVSGGNVGVATDEFVELYNPNPVAVAVTGYSLWYRSAAGTSGTKFLTLGADVSIGPGRYLLLGKAPTAAGAGGYLGTPAADFTYTAVDMSGSTSTGGQVWLTSTATAPTGLTDPTLVDQLGWGTAGLFEGTAAPSHPAAGGSLERKSKASSDAASMSAGGADVAKGNGHDTNDNGANFVARAARDPQSSASTAETP